MKTKNILHLIPKFFDDFGLQSMGFSVGLKKLYLPDYNFILNDKQHLKTCKPYPNKNWYVACKKGRKNFNGLFLNIDIDDIFWNELPLTVIYEWVISKKDSDYQTVISHEIIYRINGFDTDCNAVTNNLMLMKDKRDIKKDREPFITLFKINEYHNVMARDSLLKLDNNLNVISKRREHVVINAIPESYLFEKTPFRTPLKEDAFDVDFRYVGVVNRDFKEMKKGESYLVSSKLSGRLLNVYDCSNGVFLGEFPIDLFDIHIDIEGALKEISEISSSI